MDLSDICQAVDVTAVFVVWSSTNDPNQVNDGSDETDVGP
jgi:hypothetical protein